MDLTDQKTLNLYELERNIFSNIGDIPGIVRYELIEDNNVWLLVNYLQILQFWFFLYHLVLDFFLIVIQLTK